MDEEEEEEHEAESVDRNPTQRKDSRLGMEARNGHFGLLGVEIARWCSECFTVEEIFESGA